MVGISYTTVYEVRKKKLLWHPKYMWEYIIGGLFHIDTLLWLGLPILPRCVFIKGRVLRLWEYSVFLCIAK